MTQPSHKPQLLIVGNGMAATRLLDELLSFSAGDLPYAITVLGEESVPGYNRILLSPWLAGEIKDSEIITHSHDWYRQHGITLRSGDPVSDLDLSARQLTTASGKALRWDKLVLATGSRAMCLPVPGADAENVLCLRTLDDVLRLKMLSAQNTADAANPQSKKFAVIGGGLLGLEAACGLAAVGATVSVVHNAAWLMNRQLDQDAGEQLADTIAQRGLQILTNAVTEKILCNANNKVTGLQFADGSTLDCDVVVQAMGVVPEITLAKQAGLVCRRAIAVDRLLRTSAADVFALGECCQIGDELFGLVAPVYQQAEVLAARLCGEDSEGYQREVLPTRLKVSGVEVFSAGDITEADALVGADADSVRSLVWRDDHAGHYRRLFFNDNRLIAAVMLGNTEQGNDCFDLIQSRTLVEDPLALVLGLPQGSTLDGKHSANTKVAA